MVLSVAWDLSVRASDWVAKNSPFGLRLCGLFLVTRPRVSTNKSHVARRNHALIVCYMHFAAHVYSLTHECNYCTLVQNPTSVKPVTVSLNLVFLVHLQVDPQHSCGLFKETKDRSTIRMYHSELPSHRLTMGFSCATILTSHCGRATQWDMAFVALSVPLK